MRFGLVDSSGLCQAFVLPATAPAPNSWRPGRPTRAVSSLHEEARSRSLEAKWPWIFEQPGRCVDLPAEEIFSGFEGLLLLDELNDTDNQDDGTYSKVSREVRNACYSSISPNAATAPELVILSEAAATLTGIPLETARARRRREEEGGVQEKEVALALTGTNLEVFEGAHPFSSNYGGHQFGNWAGQLGDGRVCTLGEIQTVDHRSPVDGVAGIGHGSLVEIQLKGIGQTPFSRGGDGKAVLGACLREFLFSEAFLGLGLPAAVAVSVCSTGEGATIRDSDPNNSGALKRARGAVLCRAAPSFLRFGSFELPARRGDYELVRKLADYCLRHLGPHFELNLSKDARDSGDERRRPGHPMPPGKDHGTEQNKEEAQKDVNGNTDQVGSRDDYLGLLVAIVQATARMVAGWQALGFCHGVLNTDNCTLLGLGLDFGPCSFMEKYDPTWSPNEGDSALRYAFQNQPDVSAWNCERLAEAFASIVGVSGVTQANEAFSPAFDAAYTANLERKLGLFGMELGSGWMHPSRSGGGAPRTTKDARFVLTYFRLMSACRVDFTDTWRALLDVPASSVAGKAHPFSEPRMQSEAGTMGGKPRPCARLGAADKAGNRCASSTEEGIICNTDEEMLRPLLSVLKAAGTSSEQMREWASWVREYSSRIDTQGIGNSHPEGQEEGRRERLEVMRKSSPSFILRAANLEQALKAAEKGDMALIHQLEERLSKAYIADRSEQAVSQAA